ncbi:MAG: DUF1831 domain-containing protein [Streptococcaceae bacterium]|jgi:hypothetical protein|nr:DUF1831 domain-containing protein [Streptococcaceae bacterium]
MAFEKRVQLESSKYGYRLSPSVKKFTLRDNGFSETPRGNFQFERLLETVPNSGEGFKLKIIVNNELTKLKLSITDDSGLRSVNIFKNSENEIIQEKFYFQMQTLVDRGVLNFD